jgi:hypothetical protein
MLGYTANGLMKTYDNIHLPGVLYVQTNVR